jgi:hypothetical protein
MTWLQPPKSGSARFKLVSGTYQARWFNPQTGVSIRLPVVPQVATGDWTSPAAADAGDWALLLERGNR